MSSILKALKKVEVETVDKNTTLSWPEGLNTRETLRRRVRIRRTSFVTVGLAAALGCLLVVGAGWYFMSDQADAPESEALNDSQPIRPQVAGPVARTPATVEQKRDRPAVARTRRQPVRRQSTRAQRPARSDAITRTVKPATVERAPVQNRSKPIPVGRKAPQDVPLLPSERGKLTLQAISWSQEPSARIAVINGQILREGATLEGFTIRKISPDEVVVRSGTDDWRLTFSHQSP